MSSLKNKKLSQKTNIISSNKYNYKFLIFLPKFIPDYYGGYCCGLVQFWGKKIYEPRNKKECGLVWFNWPFKLKSNQTDVVLVGSVVEVFCETIQLFVSNIKIKLKVKNNLFSKMFQIWSNVKISFSSNDVSISMKRKTTLFNKSLNFYNSIDQSNINIYAKIMQIELN